MTCSLVSGAYIQLCESTSLLLCHRQSKTAAIKNRFLECHFKTESVFRMLCVVLCVKGERVKSWFNGCWSCNALFWIMTMTFEFWRINNHFKKCACQRNEKHLSTCKKHSVTCVKSVYRPVQIANIVYSHTLQALHAEVLTVPYIRL